MTPPAHEMLNTTFSVTPSAARRLPPRLWIHPEGASARGIADGDWMVVFNDLGRLHLVARVTTDVRPGLTLCEFNFRGADVPGPGNLNHLAHGDPVAPRGCAGPAGRVPHHPPTESGGGDAAADKPALREPMWPRIDEAQGIRPLVGVR